MRQLNKKLEAWWKEHGGNPESAQWLAFVDSLGPLLQRKLKEVSEEHSNAGRFGMSKAGGCTRAAVLKWLDAEAEPFTGSTNATFFIGHLLEVALGVASLKALGFEMVGGQQPVSIDPFMTSASDDIIAPHPLLGNKKTILSIKTNGYKMSGKTKEGWKRFGFAQLPLDGVKKTSPGNWAQAQAEMHGSGIDQILVLYVAKDIIKAMQDDPIMRDSGSLTFYAELIHYDKAWCETQLLPVWEGAWASAQRGDPGPALYLTQEGVWVELVQGGDKAANRPLTGTYSPCEYCDFREACVERKGKEAAA